MDISRQRLDLFFLVQELVRMPNVNRLLAMALWSGLVIHAGHGLAQPEPDFLPKTPPLDTPWTAEVPIDDPRPEYPRPQLVREAWQSLNGIWEFGPASDGDPIPVGGTLIERIRVPFPIQSALSGIMRTELDSWYRRTFTLPSSWSGQRVLLHFGGVNHVATVYVNGQELGTHRGSYDAFSFDITDHLDPSGDNELVVRVVDPGGLAREPLGKQFPVQGGILFTPSSGIWQTVWLEPVPLAHLTRLDQTPDLDRDELLVTAHVENASDNHTVVLTALRDGEVVGTASGPPNSEIALPVPNPRLWSPDDPFLYDLEVEVREGDEPTERVESYFGMRSIGLAEVGGVTRMVLNGRFVFQTGVLDQGYWPDGLYSAPTDEALRYDIEITKQAGFNLIRKHVKVEPQRWYYWADRLGMLVWQDMPNTPIYVRPDDASKAQFELELAEMIDEHRSHPSIVVWVPFNEGWGQFDVERIVSESKLRDPSRLFIGNSGSANCCVGIEPDSSDVRSSHLYSGPYAAPPDHRASVTSEFGTCTGRSPGHEWDPSSDQAEDRSDAANEGLLRRQWDALAQQMRSPGLSAAVFTEIYDIERELAGIYTYDRRINRCSAELLAQLNGDLIAASLDVSTLTPRGSDQIPEGQVAYYGFDEGEGDVASDGGGSGRDLSLRNGAAWASDGMRGSALDVQGSGEHAVSAEPVVDVDASFTVSAWLRHRNRFQTAAAVSQHGEDGAGFHLGLRNSEERLDLVPAYRDFPPDPEEYPPWRWTFDVPDQEGCLGAECGTRTNSSYGDMGRMPFEGVWEHVVGVVDRESRAISIYVNGEHVSTEVADYAWTAEGLFAVGVGRASDPESDSFDGSIDELRVFARALSAEEVWQLYAADGGYEAPRSGGGGCSAGGTPPKDGLLSAMLALFGALCGLASWRRHSNRCSS